MSADLIERLRATYTAWNNPPSDGLPEGAGVLIEAADALAGKDTALSEMRAELDLARKALEPFAKLSAEMFRNFEDGGARNASKSDDTAVWGYNNAELTYGDFRRARAASQDEGEER